MKDVIYQHKIYRIIIFIVITSFLSELTLSAQDNVQNLYKIDIEDSLYEFNFIRECIIIFSGGLLLLSPVLLDRYKVPLDDSDISGLSRNEVNRFDRSATWNWSTRSDRFSDYSMGTLFFLPLSFLLSGKTRNDIWGIGLLYIETILISKGVTRILKSTIHRKRPFVYNPDAPINKKIDKEALKSFPSGHTSTAFSAAVFFSKVFSDYYEGSIWRYTVWIGTLLVASTVGYLRYRAGVHYPSDIITGALIGSASGFLIPYFHKRRDNAYAIRASIIVNKDSELLLGIEFSF